MIVSFVYAQLRNPAIGDLGNLSAIEFVQGLLKALIGLGLVIGGVVFLFMLVVGGIQWITAGGDKISLESARRKVANALIGLVFLFSIFAILNLVSCFFGVDFTRINIGPFNVSFGSNPFCPQSSDDGGGGSTPPTGGNPNCPCSGSCGGYYAVTGIVGRRYFSGSCYRCTARGWVAVEGNCGILPCNEPNWDCRAL